MILKDSRFSWAFAMIKCAQERPGCRKMRVPKMCRNRRKNVQVLEKSPRKYTGFREQWAHGCCHISFPKSCYDGKHANVSGVSR